MCVCVSLTVSQRLRKCSNGFAFAGIEETETWFSNVGGLTKPHDHDQEIYEDSHSGGKAGRLSTEGLLVRSLGFF